MCLKHSEEARMPYRRTPPLTYAMRRRRSSEPQLSTVRQGHNAKRHSAAEWSCLGHVEDQRSPLTFSSLYGDCVNEFISRQGGRGVVGNIHIEGGVHLLIGIAGPRVFHDGNVVAELSGIADRCFHARAMSPMTMSLWRPCFLSCRSKSVFAKPLEHRISPGGGVNSGRISPPHVPYSKVFRVQAAVWIGAMYFHVS